ncbi:MAG: ABC transporter substrate-binding protein [Betaproteobacteria bacterium]
MNKRRKLVLALGAGVFTASFGSFAQPQGKVWRIGYLDSASRQSTVDSGRYASLIQGLSEQGYFEGKNIVIEARYAESDEQLLNSLAGDLAGQKLDLILSTGTAATQALQRTKTTIPIVVTVSVDPVSDGFAVSLARPGKNITGMSLGNEETVQKLVELLILAVPKSKRITVLVNPANGGHAPLLSRIKDAARLVGKQADPVNVRTPSEIDRGFESMAREHTDAVIILGDAFLFSQRTRIAGLALKHRLPSAYPQPLYAEVGGLLSYGSDTNENFRRAAIFVKKIFKGERAGDIPFELPTRYYLVVNRKTAVALGIKLDGELMARADKVIE